VTIRRTGGVAAGAELLREKVARAVRIQTVPYSVKNPGMVAVESARDEIAAFCQRHQIRRLSLFGSVLRDDFRAGSDVDVLVEFEPASVPGFFEYVGMKEELAALLGLPVDFRTPKSLSPYFRDRVLREAVPLHDAA
jgi:hypothetical protein